MIELHRRLEDLRASGPCRSLALTRRLVPDRQGRVRRPDRAQRRGQDHAAPPALPRRAAHRGRDRGRSASTCRRSGAVAGRRAAPLDRRRLPGRQAPAGPHRLRERRLRAARARHAAARDHRRAPSTRSRRWGSPSRAQAYPAQLSQGEAQRAALARAIVRNAAAPPRRRAHRQPRRGHGRRDPRRAQGHLGAAAPPCSSPRTRPRLAAALKRRTPDARRPAAS